MCVVDMQIQNLTEGNVCDLLVFLCPSTSALCVVRCVVWTLKTFQSLGIRLLLLKMKILHSMYCANEMRKKCRYAERSVDYSYCCEEISWNFQYEFNLAMLWSWHLQEFHWSLKVGTENPYKWATDRQTALCNSKRGPLCTASHSRAILQWISWLLVEMIQLRPMAIRSIEWAWERVNENQMNFCDHFQWVVAKLQSADN